MTEFGQPWRPSCNKSSGRNRGTEFCARARRAANENGWTGRGEGGEGRLGLRSATRCCSGGILGVLGGRVRHDQAEEPTGRRRGGEDHGRRELFDASARLDREGFWWRPSWPELREGKRPPENTTGEPGEWQHGWQYWESSVSDSFSARQPCFQSVPPRPELTFVAHFLVLALRPSFRSDSTRAGHFHALVPCAALGEAPTRAPR